MRELRAGGGEPPRVGKRREKERRGRRFATPNSSLPRVPMHQR